MTDEPVDLIMKSFTLTILLAFPLLAFSAGWDYYVLNEDGNWESISPREVDLSIPRSDAGGNTADSGRIMILFNQTDTEPKRRETLNWIRQIGSDLVEQVE